MQQIPEKIDSKFRFVLLASHRAEQFMRGAQPKVDQTGKYTRVAIDEILNDMVTWDYGPAEGPAEEGADEAASDETAAPAAESGADK